MKHKSKLRSSLLVLTCLLVCQAAMATTTRVGAEFVGETVTPVTVTVNLANGTKPNQWKPGDPVKEIPMRFRRPKGWERPEALPRGYGIDPLALKQWDATPSNGFGGGAQFDTPLVNVDGLDFTGVNPSDTNGDVGIDHYVQSINNSASSGILILNKADGTTAAQFVLDDIAAGSGTGCGGGRGDPVIMYDQYVDNGPGNPKGRWVLTEFTSTSLCIYISVTESPIGPTNDSTWHIYEFNSASGGLPDYPKFGVWRDAYYMGANESNRQYAFDRDNMINGDPARGYQVFSTVGLPGFGFQHLMPADADGETLPPAGAPGIFMRHRDAQYHGDPGSDVLEIWEFTTDFDNPGNSAITGPINIDVSDFDTNLGGTNFGDLSVPQPDGATNLFPLKQPLMWRVQHRTLDDKQYLIGNMTTDVNGNDYHGVRWWILERPAASTAGGWILSDEGTYTSGDGITTGDGVHRWMASAAMDGSGNVAIGYNTSSVAGNNNSAADVYAGMRYAGRLASDPAGTMPRGENSIIEGTASNSSGRYGDYTSLSVDPVDECTFWYTAQYNTSGNWSTRVASFRFEQCGCLLDIGGVDLISAVANTDNNIQLTWDDEPVIVDPDLIYANGFDGETNAAIVEFRIYRSTTPGGGYELIDVLPGQVGAGPYTYDDDTVSAGTTYYYIVRTSDGGACFSSDSTEQSATATGVCTLEPVFAGIENADNDATSTCGITTGWSAASSQCPNGLGDINYSVYRSTDPAFVPSGANQIATGIDALTYNDMAPDLVSDTDFFYIVRATDLDNGLEETNTVLASAFPTGEITPEVFNENLDAYVDFTDAEASGWSTFADAGATDWRIESGDDNTTGTSVAFVSSDLAAVADKSLMTKQFSPSATSVLSFFHKYDFEPTYDGGVLEILVDGSGTWVDLESNFITGSYDATLNGGFGQPLGARPAWNGLQATFTQIEVDLSAYAGQVVNVRWRMGTDVSVAAGDWKIDDIVITDSGTFGVCTPAP